MTPTTKLNHAFWSRVLTEYDAAASADNYLLCFTSGTFHAAFYNGNYTHHIIRTLAGQFLANTNFGAEFDLGFLLLFRPYDPDTTPQARHAVRRAFLLWNITNTHSA